MAKNWWDDLEDSTVEEQAGQPTATSPTASEQPKATEVATTTPKPEFPNQQAGEGVPAAPTKGGNWWDSLEDSTSEDVAKPVAAASVVDEYSNTENQFKQSYESFQSDVDRYNQLRQIDPSSRTPQENVEARDVWNRIVKKEPELRADQEKLTQLRPLYDQYFADQDKKQFDSIEELRANPALSGSVDQLHALRDEQKAAVNAIRDSEDTPENKERRGAELSAEFDKKRAQILEPALENYKRRSEIVADLADAQMWRWKTGEDEATAKNRKKLILGSVPENERQSVIDDANVINLLATSPTYNAGTVNGEIRVAPRILFDTKKVEEEVAKLPAEDIQKKTFLKNLPKMQEEAAAQQIPLFNEMGEFKSFVSENGLEDKTDLEKIQAFQQHDPGWYNKLGSQIKYGFLQGLTSLKQQAWALGGSSAELAVMATDSQKAREWAGAFGGAMVDKAKEMEDLGKMSEAIGGPTPVAGLTSTVVQMAPLLIGGGLVGIGAKGFATLAGRAIAAETAANLGFATSVGLSGLQSYASTYADTTTREYNKLLESGMGEKEAMDLAMKRSFYPSVVSGLITSTMTAIGGKTGVESVFTLLENRAYKGTVSSFFKELGKNMAMEGLVEEGPDQFLQGILAKVTTNPEMTWPQIIADTTTAVVYGGVLGGAFGAGTYGMETMGARSAIKRRTPSMEKNRQIIAALEGEAAFISKSMAGSDSFNPTDNAMAFGAKPISKPDIDALISKRENLARQLENDKLSSIDRNSIQEELSLADLDYYRALQQSRNNLLTEQVSQTVAAMGGTDGDAARAILKIANGESLDSLTGRERVAAGVTKTAKGYSNTTENPIIKVEKDGNPSITEDARKKVESLGLFPMVRMIDLSNEAKLSMAQMAVLETAEAQERARQDAEKAANDPEAKRLAPETADAVNQASQDSREGEAPLEEKLNAALEQAKEAAMAGVKRRTADQLLENLAKAREKEGLGFEPLSEDASYWKKMFPSLSDEDIAGMVEHAQKINLEQSKKSAKPQENGPQKINVGGVSALRVEQSDSNRIIYEIKGSRNEIRARFDYTLDGNGVWRPTPGSGIHIFDKTLRGTGLGEKFTRKFADSVGDVGSTGITEDEGTSGEAQKMWRRIGAPLEDLPNTDPELGSKRAFVLRGSKSVSKFKPQEEKPIKTEVKQAKPKEEQLELSLEEHKKAFEDISPAHKKFSGMLDTLVRGGALTEERKAILMEVFRDTSAKTLDMISTKMDIEGRPGWYTVDSNRVRAWIAMTENAVKKFEGGLKSGSFWANPMAEPTVIFLHEYGHIAYWTVLDDSERAIVDKVYNKLKDEGRIVPYVQEGMVETPKQTRYIASNAMEFSAQSFAEYAITNKVSDPEMKSVLQKLMAKFKGVLDRIVNRANVSPEAKLLEPIFKKMLQGAENPDIKMSLEGQKVSVMEGGTDVGGSKVVFIKDEEFPEDAPEKEYHKLLVTTRDNGDMVLDTEKIVSSMKDRSSKFKGDTYGKKFIVKVDGETTEFASTKTLQRFLSAISSGSIARIYVNGNGQVVADFDISSKEERVVENALKSEGKVMEGGVAAQLSAGKAKALGVEGNLPLLHLMGSMPEKFTGVGNAAQLSERVGQVLTELRSDIKAGKFNNTAINKKPYEAQLGRELSQQEYDTMLADMRSKQERIYNGWVDYLENGGYTPEVQSLILNAITKEIAIPKADGGWSFASLGKNADRLPDPASPELAAFVAREVTLPENKAKRISQIIAEGSAAAEESRRNQKEQVVAETETGDSITWVRFPSKEEDPANFDRNVQDLTSLAKTSSKFGKCDWCTGNGAAAGQLQMGDFWVGVDPNGNARVAVRMKGKDQIAEVRGILEGQDLETSMAPAVVGLFEEKGWDGGKWIDEAKMKTELAETISNATTAEEAISDINTTAEKYGYVPEVVTGTQIPEDVIQLPKIKSKTAYGGANIQFRGIEKFVIGKKVAVREIKDTPKGAIPWLVDHENIYEDGDYSSSVFLKVHVHEAIATFDFVDNLLSSGSSVVTVKEIGYYASSHDTSTINVETIEGNAYGYDTSTINVENVKGYARSYNSSTINAGTVGESATSRDSSTINAGTIEGHATSRDTSTINVETVKGNAGSDDSSTINAGTVGDSASSHDSSTINAGTIESYAGGYNSSTINAETVGESAISRDASTINAGTVKSGAISYGSSTISVKTVERNATSGDRSTINSETINGNVYTRQESSINATVINGDVGISEKSKATTNVKFDIDALQENLKNTKGIAEKVRAAIEAGKKPQVMEGGAAPTTVQPIEDIGAPLEGGAAPSEDTMPIDPLEEVNPPKAGTAEADTMAALEDVFVEEEKYEGSEIPLRVITAKWLQSGKSAQALASALARHTTLDEVAAINVAEAIASAYDSTKALREVKENKAKREQAQREQAAEQPKMREYSLYERATDDKTLNAQTKKMVARVYEQLSNPVAAATAEELLNGIPLDDAVKMVQDTKNDIPQDIRNIASIILTKRYSKEAAEAKKLFKGGNIDEETYMAVLKEQVDFTDWVFDQAKESGRAVQVFSLWTKLGADGIMYKFRRDFRKAASQAMTRIRATVDGFKRDIEESDKKSFGESAKLNSSASKKLLRGGAAKAARQNAVENEAKKYIKRAAEKIEGVKIERETNPVAELIGPHLNKKYQAGFIKSAMDLGVSRETAEKIDALAMKLQDMRNAKVLEKEIFDANRKAFNEARVRLARENFYLYGERPSVWDQWKQVVSDRLARSLMRGNAKAPVPTNLQVYTDMLTENLLGFVPKAERERATPKDFQKYIETALNDKFYRSEGVSKDVPVDDEGVPLTNYRQAIRKTIDDISERMEGMGESSKERAQAAIDFLEEMDKQVKEFPVSDALILKFIEQKAKRLEISMTNKYTEWYKSGGPKTRERLAVELADTLLADMKDTLVSSNDWKALAKKVVEDFTEKAKQRRQKALERYKIPREAKQRAAYHPMSKFLELVNMGALTDEDAYNVMADKYDLPVFDQDFAASIEDRLQKMQDMPEGSEERKLATQSILADMERKKGFHWADIASGYIYTNMLSNPDTSIVNTISTFINVWSNAFADFISTRDPAYFKRIVEGYKKGWSKAVSILKTGKRLDMPGLEERAPLIFEMVRFGEKGGVPINPTSIVGKFLKSFAESKIASPLNAFKYISRALEAQDAMNFTASVEGSRWAQALEEAKKNGYTGKAANDEAFRILNLTDEKWQECIASANQEYAKRAITPTKEQVVKRALEIQESNVPDEIKNNSFERGLQDVLRGKPKGFAGWMAEGLNNRIMSIKNPIARTASKILISPFVMTPTNLFNVWLDYSPYGYVRMWKGTGNLFGDKYYHKAERGSAEWRAQMWKANSSVFVIAAMWLLVKAGLLKLIGKGPDDPEKKQDWLDQGNRPYTIQIGNGPQISFKYTPWALVLTYMANVENYNRYKAKKDDSLLKRYAVASAMMPNLLMELPFFQGPADLYRIVNPEGNVNYMKRLEMFWASKFSSTIPLQGFFSYMDKIFDPTEYRSEMLGGAFIDRIPFARRSGKEVLNIWGRPIHETKGSIGQIMQRYASMPDPSVESQVLAKFDIYPYFPKPDETFTWNKKGERVIATPKQREIAQKDFGDKFSKAIKSNQFLMDSLKKKDLTETEVKQGKRIIENIAGKLRPAALAAVGGE